MSDTGFSGVVRLSNVSDFIAPNLDCIIPLETNTKKTEAPLVNIRKKEAGPKKEEAKESVKISLADCLACNGCITSAETVLIEEQSLTRLWQGVESSKLSVVTISPQALCSIAVKMGINASECAKRISSYLISRGVHHVVDSSFARQLSLKLLYEELMNTPSTSRPVLSSACPGFVCYAEKSHGELLVPKISKIRSPQAVAGALVKNYLSLKYQIEPCQIYHASIMPCFDKKLEASREQLYAPGTAIRETDCVVSAAELYESLKEDAPSINTDNLPSGWLGDVGRGLMIGNDGGTSGGYAETIAREHLSRHGGEIKISRLNKHMDTMEINGGAESLKIARVYGFRNIQNVVRKLKNKKGTYDYIEVMACPSGCGNGGGQIRYDTSDEREKKLENVEQMYDGLTRVEGDEIGKLTQEWSNLNPNWKQLLLTDYKPVETNISQNLKW